MTAEIKECSLLERTDIEYTNKTQNEKDDRFHFADLKDAVDFARIIQADNIRLTADLARVKAERDAAIEDLERIMLQGGSSTDTCAYCGNQNCYQRAGHEVCNPVWTRTQHLLKMLNCGECDRRFFCEIEPEDCDRLYHPADPSERMDVLPLVDSEKKDACPFYKGKENNKICCEPLIPDTGLSIAFSSEEQMKDYMESFCKGSYNKCLLAQEHGRM